MSAIDKNDARKSIIKLHKNAAQGQPFATIFDNKQYHLGHEFKHQGELIKIYRVRLSGDIRIFIYFLDRKILILKVLAKRENKLNDTEKAELEFRAKKVVQCIKKKAVHLKGAVKCQSTLVK